MRAAESLGLILVLDMVLVVLVAEFEADWCSFVFPHGRDVQRGLVDVIHLIVARRLGWPLPVIHAWHP